MTIEQIKVIASILFLAYMALPSVDENEEGKGE
jgi:hypothetical protein